jgi:CTP:molybdopterin cytidylyltransferase MocA
LETTLANVLTARVGETLVVVGHEAAEIKVVLAANTIFHFSLFTFHSKKGPLSINAKNAPFFTILTNKHYEKGMTTTIQTGVEAADLASLGYLICLSDMPFITAAEYQFLAQQFLIIREKDPQAIVQPTFEGKRGNPTIFSNVYRESILQLTDTEGCKPIVKTHAEHVYLVEMPTNSVLKDIDSKEEYVRLIDSSRQL